MVRNNCNHFCDAVCLELTGNRIPKYINAAANAADSTLLKHLIPESMVATPGADETNLINDTKLTQNTKVLDEDEANSFFQQCGPRENYGLDHLREAACSRNSC